MKSLAVASALILAGASGAQAAQHSEGDQIGFSTPTIVDPISTFGEPTIGVDPVGGNFFASGPTGTGTQRSQWETSNDGGSSFRIMTPAVPPTGTQSTEDPPGGGDTDLNFDRRGKVYFADLYALTCFRTATSTASGDQIQTAPNGCAGDAPADRQWITVYDPKPQVRALHQSAYTGPTPLAYLEYNNIVSGAAWKKSNDYLTFSDAVAGDTPATKASYAPFGADGYPQIDQTTGKVFQAAGMQQPDGSYSLLLNIGTPDAQGNLTFLDAPTAASGGSNNTGGLIPIVQGLTNDPDTLFVVLSMDKARNLFVAYTTNGGVKDWQTYVSVASAKSGWKKWTPPVKVSDGLSSTGDAVNIFPWIKAGGAGRADAVWYGSDKQVDPSSDSGQAWNVFMAQTVFPVDDEGAVTGEKPKVTLVKVSPHPMHYNDACQNGTGCITVQGNRNLADFFSVTIDKKGAAQIIYDDTSNGLSQSGFEPGGNQTLDHAGAPLVMIAHQTSGLSLYGKRLHGPSSAPTTGISHEEGDATWPVIGGTAVPGMDLLGSSMAMDSKAGTLTITNKVLDLSSPATTLSQLPGSSLLQYITRWQMGNTIYYAGMTDNVAGQPLFYAGPAQSVDLCSVSACDPHVITYPETGLGGTAETGHVDCPPAPSRETPCTVTITVNLADVGSPTAASSLEEVGTYAFAASHPQGVTTNAQAQANNLPLEIDGACCFNFGAPIKASRVSSGTAPFVTGGREPGRGYFAPGHVDTGSEPARLFW